MAHPYTKNKIKDLQDLDEGELELPTELDMRHLLMLDLLVPVNGARQHCGRKHDIKGVPEGDI